MCTKGTQVPCKVPSLPYPTTRKGWHTLGNLVSRARFPGFGSQEKRSEDEVDHRGLRPLLFSNEGERRNTYLIHETTKFMLCFPEVFQQTMTWIVATE